MKEIPNHLTEQWLLKLTKTSLRSSIGKVKKVSPTCWKRQRPWNSGRNSWDALKIWRIKRSVTVWRWKILFVIGTILWSNHKKPIKKWMVSYAVSSKMAKRLEAFTLMVGEVWQKLKLIRRMETLLMLKDLQHHKTKCLLSTISGFSKRNLPKWDMNKKMKIKTHRAHLKWHLLAPKAPRVVVSLLSTITFRISFSIVKINRF